MQDLHLTTRMRQSPLLSRAPGCWLLWPSLHAQNIFLDLGPTGEMVPLVKEQRETPFDFCFYCAFILVLSNVRITRKDDSSLFYFQLETAPRWRGGGGGRVMKVNRSFSSGVHGGQ